MMLRILFVIFLVQKDYEAVSDKNSQS